MQIRETGSCTATAIVSGPSSRAVWRGVRGWIIVVTAKPFSHRARCFNHTAGRIGACSHVVLSMVPERQPIRANRTPRSASSVTWRKVHPALDTATSDIRAVAFTPGGDGDSPVLPELLDQVPEGEEIGTVTADGAYDTRRCHTAIIDRQVTAFGHSFGPVAFMPSLPIRKNGRRWKADCPAACARKETLRATRHHGRAFWKHRTGHHVQSRSEARLRRLNAFAERIAARDPDRKTAAVRISIALMNRFPALGTA